MRVVITGHDLDPAAVREIARSSVRVVIDPEALERMAAANAVVRAAAVAEWPVYGVTTGLGARVTETVRDGDGAAYSRRVILGRATAVGEPLPAELVRAAMVVRLNGLCAGGAGASPAVAEALAAMLDAGVHPIVPASGSVGAADLCLMAQVALGVIGEGEAELGGELMAADVALTRAGLRPPELGPKDGLALCSSSAVAIGAAALALVDGERCLEDLQSSAALSMEGFRANLSPLDPRVVAARPAPGQARAAAGLRDRLTGGALCEAGAARRVQDPLSFRCVSQVHGALTTALDALRAALAPELDGAADNPLVLVGEREILSTGNFQSPALALALDTAAIAVAQAGHAGAERQARLKTTRLSGLPGGLAGVSEAGLTAAGLTAAGLGPVSKTAQALVVELRQRAAPYAIHAIVGGDGVEDDSTQAAQGALRLRECVDRLRLLCASELLVAAQAVDLASEAAGVGTLRLGVGTAATHAAVRETVARLYDDRPVGAEITALERALLRDGTLGRRVAEAIGG